MTGEISDRLRWAVEESDRTSNEFLRMTGQRCAVLGRPIHHSLSPLLHTAGYEALGLDLEYFRIDAGEEQEFLALLGKDGGPARCRELYESGLCGYSVTMPGKTLALNLANERTERARLIGSANTLVLREDGTWLADNTDVDGVTACLSHLWREGLESTNSSAIVVGNGGTARPALAALAAAGIERVSIFARSDKALALQPLAEKLGMEFAWLPMSAAGRPQTAEAFDASDVIISTVPPEVSAVHAELILRASSVVDVIYDPYPTPLLEKAASAGIPHAGGLIMLAGQAEQQFRQFTNHEAPAGVMLRTALQRFSF